jgi:hypothetical protein
MELTKKSISLGDDHQIGVPFLSRSFWARTPKIARIVGDALMSLGTLGTVIAIKNPTIAIICAVSGWLGKVISNSVSEK